MNIFISANNTNCGKTYVTSLLIESISKLNLKVAVMKPIETGVYDYPVDGKILLDKLKEYNPYASNLSLDDIVPVQLKLAAAPFVAGDINFKKIEESYKKLKSISDVLLIEGAGGLLVPVKDNFFMVDFLKFFDAKLFLVICSKLGMINDFLLNKYYLESHNINYEWAINLFDNSYFKISDPFMKQFKPFFIQRDLDKIVKKLIGDLDGRS